VDAAVDNNWYEGHLGSCKELFPNRSAMSDQKAKQQQQQKHDVHIPSDAYNIGLLGNVVY